MVPVISIDWTDSPFLTTNNQAILQESTLYFKRELPYDRLLLYYYDRPTPWSVRRKELLPVLENVRNIPLGIEDTKYTDLKMRRRVAEKDIDIFFAGTITNTQRHKGLEILSDFALRTSWNVIIKESLPFDEYCEMIARSKITISIAGGGWDCFRHYEAVALGSLPVMNRPTIDAVWWHPMPEEIFFENNFANFTTRLEQLLADDRLRQTCFETLETRVEGHMLHSKIIEYIIKTSLEKLSPSL
jgi:hypothetical protein